MENKEKKNVHLHIANIQAKVICFLLSSVHIYVDSDYSNFPFYSNALSSLLFFNKKNLLLTVQRCVPEMCVHENAKPNPIIHTRNI